MTGQEMTIVTNGIIRGAMRSEDTAGGGDRQMITLAWSFPALGQFYFRREELGLDPWDPSVLMEASASWSAAERMIVSFLLTVWMGEFPPQGEAAAELGAWPFPWLKPFNPVEAHAIWSAQDWRAFKIWVMSPFRV